MAEIQTSYYTQAASRSFARNAAPSMKNLQKQLRFAEFTITLTVDATQGANAGLLVNDNYLLGQLGQDAHIIPNLSFLVGVSGTAGAAYTLEKVTALGQAPTALSGAVTRAANGTAAPLGAATGATTGFPQIAKGEYLQLTVTTATSMVSGDVMRLVVAYLPNDNSVN